MFKFPVSYKGQDGRPVYKVPCEYRAQRIGICAVESWEPRCPRNGWMAYYPSDYSYVLLVCSPGTANYLARRKYAEFVGVAEYAPCGYKAGRLPEGFKCEI